MIELNGGFEQHRLKDVPEEEKKGFTGYGIPMLTTGGVRKTENLTAAERQCWEQFYSWFISNISDTRIHDL